MREAGPSTPLRFGRDDKLSGELSAAFVEFVFDEVRDDLGIGFAHEAVAASDEGLLERDVVFDDAVLHDDECAGAVAVRVRVLLGGAAVGAQRVWPMP